MSRLGKVPVWGGILLVVGVGLAIVALVTVIALSGVLGTSFALSWIVALIVGAFGALFIISQFKDPVFAQVVGLMLVMIGVVLYVSNILPELSLIIAVVGIMSLIFGFVQSGGNAFLGVRRAAPVPASS